MKIFNKQTNELLRGEIYKHEITYEDCDGTNRWVTTVFLDCGIIVKLEESELAQIHRRMVYPANSTISVSWR